ncbi:MAG: NADH:flavin oxidoreductase / NADH oxidase [SAR116 cluster bacterium]|nr:NADH:flavin oxidoreductase / NADH oxidase [SAR116 cluster bacterium]RPH09065.1 MAG: NADH:flavin oxidoreductase/NADH oxidase [Alphaproteobacteria bacterium TMED54]|tara:strand:+ start:358 stop:1494 length:1137 start_codon:yes stop_codon:yes gene_type:complete
MKKSNLFSSFELKNKTFRNRVILSPMCQYKAKDGSIDDWHLQHYSRFAFSGLGGAFIEATAVSPEGRIGYGCTGIWHDNHVEGLKKITKIFKNYNCRSGIQLAHAGRKASFLRPWDGAKPIETDEGYEKKWQIIGPSSIPVNSGTPVPLEMSQDDINRVKEDFKNAALRSIKAGFDMIEVHGAHGYLLHSFFSPLSNNRNDKYGGSLENRMRFGIEVVRSIKSILPDNILLFFRISSVDGAENGTKFEENIAYARELKKAGVDIIDCSSGGIGGSPVLTKSKIIPGFQVPYSERIKKEANINTMAVGAIIEPDQAEDIITYNRADLIAIGRELLADTQWVYKAATRFGLSNSKDFLPDSYSFFLSRRDDYLDRSAKPA